MKIQSPSERGQVLVIISVALVALIAMVGLAVDGGFAFSDRRHAQNAADTAALAGALARINLDLGWTNVARDMAGENGYSGDLVNNQVEVYLCTDENASCDLPAGANPDDYLQVIITSTINTFFARVIGVPTITNRVQAVALADTDDSSELFDGRSIVALNPDCPPSGSLIISGDSLITINGGGMLANADETCSFKCTSTSVSVDIIGGELESSAGSFDSFSEHCQAELVDDGVSYGGEQLPYPPLLPDFDIPPECDPAMAGTATSGVWDDPMHGLVNAHYLTPGYYGTFPPKKDVNDNLLEKELVMLPGTYCVDTVLKLNTEQIHLWGQGVTIWIRAGNGFTINGGIVQLYGSSEDYPGYLIIVEPDYDGAVTACNLEGNAFNKYVGAIYAPHCDVTVNGTADTPPDGIDSQIIGYNVTINGTSNLIINYDADNNPYVTDLPKIGITQ